MRSATSLMFWLFRKSLMASRSSDCISSWNFSFGSICSGSKDIRERTSKVPKNGNFPAKIRAAAGDPGRGEGMGLVNYKTVQKMILPQLFIGQTGDMGRGVFTTDNIDKGTIIETSPVIVMSGAERKLLDQTLLHDYIFEWGDDRKSCAMALGYVPLYNHSYRSNCEYEMDFVANLISVKAVRFIKAGEEVFINYNGDWNNAAPVWFDK